MLTSYKIKMIPCNELYYSSSLFIQNDDKTYKLRGLKQLKKLILVKEIKVKVKKETHFYL